MKFNFEDRLMRYAVSIPDVVEKLPDNKGASHLGNQFIRTGTAPAIMFGEATAAGLRRDFIHKMKLVLKYLRESLNCLKIIHLKKYMNDNTHLDLINPELISIFVNRIQTAKKNMLSEKVA